MPVGSNLTEFILTLARIYLKNKYTSFGCEIDQKNVIWSKLSFASCGWYFDRAYAVLRGVYTLVKDTGRRLPC